MKFGDFNLFDFDAWEYVGIFIGTIWIGTSTPTHGFWEWAGTFFIVVVIFKAMDFLWEGAKYLKRRNQIIESASQMDTFVGRLSYAKYLRATNLDKFNDFIESFDEDEREKLKAALRLEDAVEATKR